MNKKIIALSLMGLFLVSCSSAPKEEQTAPVPQQEAAKSAAGKANSNLIEMKPAEVKTNEVGPAKPIKYNVLNSAILSKNDERIRNASIEVLQNSPKDIKALNSLAMSYLQKGNTEAALMLLNKMISIEPRSSSAHSNLGLLYLGRNEKRDAIDMFKKALEYDSDNHTAAANLGAIYVKEKDYTKALIALEQTVEEGKADDSTINNYAIALTATGQEQEAASIYEKLLNKNTSNKNAMLNLAIVYIDKLNKFDEGLDLINRLKFVGPDLDARQTIKELENKAKAGLR
jgi:Flp pilus assembly protein TadD